MNIILLIYTFFAIKYAIIIKGNDTNAKATILISSADMNVSLLSIAKAII